MPSMMPASQNGINAMYAISNPAPYLFFFSITRIYERLAFCHSKKEKEILACHQLLQKLASPKELMLQQQMLDAKDHLTTLQPPQTNTCHYKSISILYSLFSLVKGNAERMELYPISTENAKSRSCGSK